MVSLEGKTFRWKSWVNEYHFPVTPFNTFNDDRMSLGNMRLLAMVSYVGLFEKKTGSRGLLSFYQRRPAPAYHPL